ncbi:DUF4097 family beta strand repeat-containing protein [Streptomyces sp. SudanB25_2051]|uniref:DUF4097 family beta strand repeat-containing protein n=1 Tax=Streptomyces sp. SudanB25_2051 TaxID=3035275 RepID=UPI003F567108
MPEFDTPQPITATVDFEVGTARIIAGKRTTTTVEVRPANSAEESDVRAAQQAKVSYADGRLTVKVPRKRSLFTRSAAVDVTVELPSGSDVHASTALADFLCEGRFGAFRVKTSAGDIRVAEAQSAQLRTTHGAIAVDRVTGDADITGAGRVDVGEIGGTATVRNLMGDTTVGRVGGTLKASSSYGPISVGVALADVEAKSAHGGLRVASAARGTVTLNTATGDIEVGIPRSTAAWLDVQSRIGAVRNSLDAAEGPGASDETVQIQARTGLGDITIHRAPDTGPHATTD